MDGYPFCSRRSVRTLCSEPACRSCSGIRYDVPKRRHPQPDSDLSAYNRGFASDDYAAGRTNISLFHAGRTVRLDRDQSRTGSNRTNEPDDSATRSNHSIPRTGAVWRVHRSGGPNLSSFGRPSVSLLGDSGLHDCSRVPERQPFTKHSRSSHCLSAYFRQSGSPSHFERVWGSSLRN